jgi:flotillin
MYGVSAKERENMFGYRVPDPDEAMLVSGGRHDEGVPFRVVVGRGAFIPPFFRRVRFLTLAMQESEVSEQCVTRQGIALNVQAVIAFKVGNDSESIVNAGQRFLSDQSQMPALTGRIFAGHLRSIVGSMTVEEIVTERQKLATEVLDGSKVEMARIGLTVDSLQIQSIDDMKSGYVDAMSKAQRAEVQRQAAVAQAESDKATQIAQAQAQQAAAEAQQESARNQSDYARATALVNARNNADIAKATAEAAATTGMAQAAAQAQVDKARSEAEQAGPLAQAQAEKGVAEAQTALAEQNAELRKQQLVSEVIRPAEADAEKIRVTAEAEAASQTIMSEAANAGNRVSLDQQLIGLLPDIVEKAASGLAGANLTVFNGADGLQEVTSQVIGQGLSILNTLRASLASSDGDAGKS